MRGLSFFTCEAFLFPFLAAKPCAGEALSRSAGSVEDFAPPCGGCLTQCGGSARAGRCG